MDKIILTKNILFDINITANFLLHGRYNLHTKWFSSFLAKTKESLKEYIINNNKEFVDFIKSKRNNNKKLLIRKNDNYIDKNFNIIHSLNDVSAFPNKIVFTDCGLIEVSDWINKHPEYLI